MSSSFTATDGNAYEHHMGRWSQRLAEPFLDFAKLPGGKRVLDVGCGTGSLTLALMRRSGFDHVLGLDIAPAYVAHAKGRTDDPRVTFEVGDACAVRFPNASFDAVLSLLMLHFVPRAPAAVAEMRRVARPGAVAAAAVWDARGGVVSHRIFVDTAAALDPSADALRAKHCTRPMTRPGELTAAWQAAGFREVREAALTVRMDYADFDDFWSPYDGGQGPSADYVTALDPASRDRLRDGLRRAYLDGEPDGRRSYAATAWAVHGIAPD
ncbi:class I SAM-dependent methyltransferase [Elioraea sp.]|jgi:ubiquinone/menaquinone biosynthesis C-methylase UbiE|uniref:class I SAM-dependent methyltransferase n=1 Tax=Elioraea sp. TaxID=2185103 RepID=UPI003F722CE0